MYEVGVIMDVYELLNELKIDFQEVEHPAVFTVKEAQLIERQLDGVGCKNLFLKYKDKYFVYVLRDNKRADLKELADFLGVNYLKFGKEEELYELLGLRRGSVTPLGIINDKDNKVKLVFDKEIENETILCHPNVNTKTISIKYSDLVMLIENQQHSYVVF